MDIIFLIYGILGLFLWFIPIFGCVVIAHNKRKDPVTWGILGFLLGIIGLVIIVLLPPEKRLD